MRILSSGVYAACCCAVGMFIGCSDSSDNGVSGENSNLSSVTDDFGISSSSSFTGNAGGSSPSGDLISSGAESSAGNSATSSRMQGSSSGSVKSSSSGHPHRSSSSGIEQGNSSSAHANSSSSESSFVYTSPANFADTVNGVAFNMVYVAGGTYTRGCDNCAEPDKIYETPSHKVTVDEYHIAPTEVTIAQWNAVMGGKKNAWESDKAPKIGVSWFDANNYAAWYSENSGGKSHDVATKKPNKLGLYDMSGNSWEWVYDWLVAYTDADKVNPVQLTGSGNKTRRGGSYGEPADFARVSRRAIRSRDGAADMGFRLGMSTELPPGMVSPCEAANPSAATCQGDKNRDCRLITTADEAWISDDYTVVIGENGVAAVSGFPNVSGQWYTLNNRSFNVVTKSGTKTYAYYVFSEDELTMISDDGIPYRLYRRAASEAKNKVSLPTVSNPKTLAQLIAAVEPERIVTDEQLAHPDTSVRDPRIAAASGYTWFFDGRCCGGNHKYRFHLDKSGDAEFVVMDYDDTHHENILAKGRWFTVGNIGLHIVLNGKYFNYLYTAGERTIFDDKIKRPRGFNGENPVYEAGDYQWGS